MKSPPLFHPFAMIATCFGLGRISLFPQQTAGSVLAMLVFLIPGFLDSRALTPNLMLLAGVAIILGFFSCIWYVQKAGLDQSEDIAIDAFAGLLFAVVLFFLIRDNLSIYPTARSELLKLFTSGGYYSLFSLFLLFSFFKGWHIGFARITRFAGQTRGGSSIMVDALAAGLFAAVTLHAIVLSAQYLKRPGVW